MSDERDMEPFGRFYQCDNCPTPLDQPGLCPRCLRDLNKELEDMGQRW